MPNITPTNYLQETYKIFAEIPDIVAVNDGYITGNDTKNPNTKTVFKIIEKKVKQANAQNSVSNLYAFATAWNSFKSRSENIETCQELNNISINTLIVNPTYKRIVTDLIKRINPKNPVFNETAALNLIKQQLQEFFELSRLADYASYDKWRAPLNISNLLTLGAMAKLQLCFVMDNLEKFFSHKKDNQEIQTIAATIINYLDQSAIAEGYPSTNTALSYFGTNLEAVKASLAENKQSLQNAYDIYLNNIQINQNEEISNDDEIFYDALEEQDDEDEFYDAKESFEETRSFTEKDNNPSDFEKIKYFLERVCDFNPIEFLFSGAIKLVNFLIKEIKNRKESSMQTNSKVIPENTQNFSENYSCRLFTNNPTEYREIYPRYNRLIY